MEKLDWDHEPAAVKEKLAKAYGRSAGGGVAETVEAQPEITYKSSGIVLNIEPARKAEFQAKLDEVSAALSNEISAAFPDEKLI